MVFCFQSQTTHKWVSKLADLFSETMIEFQGEYLVFWSDHVRVETNQAKVGSVPIRVDSTNEVSSNCHRILDVQVLVPLQLTLTNCNVVCSVRKQREERLKREEKPILDNALGNRTL